MEIWYDPSNMEAKAFYTHRYTGNVWQMRGCQSIESNLPIAAGALPGAIITLNRDVLTAVQLPPPAPTDPKIALLAELRGKLADDSITDVELREMFRLERGL